MSSLTVNQTMQIAFQHQQAGRLAQAEAMYRAVLQRQPRHADALHLLGVIALQMERFGEAADLIRRALSVRPRWPEASTNLGNALIHVGQLEAAVVVFREALAVNPNFAGLYCNLGNALQMLGQLDAAIAEFRQAIALQPDFAGAHYNLGNALRAQEQLEAAAAAYRQAIASNPRYAEANRSLGNVLQALGQLDAAVMAYRQAIALRHNWPEVENDLGNALRAKGQVDAAVAAYRRALALTPDFLEALCNLGLALKDKGLFDEAIAACRQAIALKPDFPPAYCNLANVLKDQGQLDETVAACRKALALNPGYVAVHTGLIGTLHYHPKYRAEAIAAELGIWNRQHAEPLSKFIRPHLNGRDPERRLRIGYVSPDFRNHVVGRNLMPLFQHRDPEKFVSVCYSNTVIADDLTEEFRRHSDAFVVVAHEADEVLAERIRADGIDILVDLSLHTADGRLLVFARKPAPVQVCFAGYPGSTGLTTMDYRLTDPYLDPLGSQDDGRYSEKSIRLPATFWCYDPLDAAPPAVGPLPALANGYVTFGCLNNFCKINEGVLKLWAQVLRGLTGSRLVLLAEAGEHRERTLNFLETLGVARERVCFESKRPRREYLEMYRQIDVGLDTFPYNGHTTSLDSYFMGVPVITLVGHTVVGRAGLSQLTNLGLPELIARTEEEFVAIAGRLARDRQQLAQMRADLRGRMQASPLMDGADFARGIEAAFRQMWRQRCAAGSVT